MKRALPCRASLCALALMLSDGCSELKSGAEVVGPSAQAADKPRTDAGAAQHQQDGGLSTQPAADEGSSSQGCMDPAGFGGLGCYRCPASDLATLENACTSAVCTPFEDALRLTKLLPDGTLPPLDTSAPGAAPADAGVATAPPVSAGKPCADLSARGTVVHVAGSSAAKPFLQQIGQQLSTAQVFVVYAATGSCVGVDAIVHGTPIKAASTSVTYWDGPASSGASCDLPAEGVSVDLAISDVFAQTCPGFALADLDALQIRDAHGPVQTMTFAVPANSPFTELSAQAAYMLYGFGSEAGILDPSGTQPIWTNESLILQRNAASGTQALLAAAIGLPPDLWRGSKHASSDEVAAALQTAATSEQTASDAIGILAADYIDSKSLRAQIRVLSFRDSGQACAVYPDSSATARDKRNVRDGHYPLWGPLHLLHKVDANGNPQNADTRAVLSDIIAYLSGSKALPNGVQLIDVYAQSGLVPGCAMAVTRTSDGGNIKSQKPDQPCACLFEAKVTGASSCRSCRVQGECGAGETCSAGFCER